MISLARSRSAPRKQPSLGRTTPPRSGSTATSSTRTRRRMPRPKRCTGLASRNTAQPTILLPSGKQPAPSPIATRTPVGRRKRRYGNERAARIAGGTLKPQGVEQIDDVRLILRHDVELLACAERVLVE